MKPSGYNPHRTVTGESWYGQPEFQFWIHQMTPHRMFAGEAELQKIIFQGTFTLIFFCNVCR